LLATSERYGVLLLPTGADALTRKADLSGVRYLHVQIE
jgi:hypothetical protein